MNDIVLTLSFRQAFEWCRSPVNFEIIFSTSVLRLGHLQSFESLPSFTLSTM